MCYTKYFITTAQFVALCSRDVSYFNKQLLAPVRGVTQAQQLYVTTTAVRDVTQAQQLQVPAVASSLQAINFAADRTRKQKADAQDSTPTW